MYPRFPYFPGHFFIWLVPLIFFSLLLKGMAMWRAARRGEKWWFIALFVLNTAGVLPLLYLFTHEDVAVKKKTSR